MKKTSYQHKEYINTNINRANLNKKEVHSYKTKKCKSNLKNCLWNSTQIKKKYIIKNPKKMQN